MQASQIFFDKILIIGLGLIGGSFAKAIRDAKSSTGIFAYDLDEEALELAKSGGAINGGCSNLDIPQEEMLSFDLIVLATPLSTYEKILKEIADKISPQTTIIDLGSVKEIQVKKFLPQNLKENFIPCHPIAGSDQSGFDRSSSDLFFGKKFIICPENTNPTSLKKVEDVARKIGGIVEFIDAKRHDEIYALVSHLPQFLSFLTKKFSPKKIENDFLKTAFRLDNSSSEMWSDIFELNGKNLEKFYLKFFKNLEFFSKNLEMIFGERFSQNSSPSTVDEKALEENFSEIFFRILVVVSFLKIPEIKIFESYAGSGFKDFTSIISILNFDQKKLQILIKKNQQKILNSFNLIS